MIDRVVVDSSVVIKWVVPEEGTDAALAIRKRFKLCAPELIVPEIANVLWKKYQRKELSRAEVGRVTGLLANSGIEYVTMNSLLVIATGLAMDLAHPACDCIYLAAAIEADIPFVMADARLVQK